MSADGIQFREISCVILGGLTGLLIGLPWAFSAQGAVAIAAPVLFAGLGTLVGFRQRKNTFFFYLCLISVIALASLISKQL